MRKIGIAGLLVLVMGLLTACGGLLGQLIGAQDAPNALGLDNVPVTANKEASEPSFGAASLAPQAVTEYFVGSTAAAFRDVDWEAIKAESPVGLPNPKSYKEKLGIKPTATVASVTPGSLPAVLSLTGVVLNIVVTDADGTTSFEKTVGSEGNVDVQLARGTCSAASCVYQADKDVGEIIQLSVSGSEFSGLWNDILTNDDPADQTSDSLRNKVEGTVVLYLESSAGTPAGTSVEVVLTTADGTVDFSK